MIKLRDYQEKAHELIIEQFKLGNKTLLVMPTGAGKSLTIVSFIEIYQRHYKFVLIVRTRGLVNQLEKDLIKFELDYGVHMNGHEKYLPNKTIQLCSKDTLESRDTLPYVGQDNVIVIVDEADEFKEWQKEIIEKYSTSKRFFYLGMTATPYNNLDQFDSFVIPITAEELKNKGHLLDYEYFIPRQIDFRDVKIKDGAFNSEDLKRKLDHGKAIRDSFESWLTFGDFRPTLVFTTSKEHGKNVAEYINNYYQKEVALYCDSDSPDEYRYDAINRFKRGEVIFLVNIRLFTRGTDIPEIGTILDIAPTLSLNLHIQKIGRGSRPNGIFKNCRLIDCANNLIINGHFYMKRKVDLTSKYKRTKKSLEESLMRVCANCFRAAEPAEYTRDNKCPYCGASNAPVKKKKISKYAKDKQEMESASPEKIEQIKMIKDYRKILWLKQNMGKVRYPKNIAIQKAHETMINKYGLEKVLKIKKAIGYE